MSSLDGHARGRAGVLARFTHLIRFTRFTRFALCASVALLALACTGSTEPDLAGGVPTPGILTTDALVYVAQPAGGSLKDYSFTVVTQYHNPTDATIYLARCSPTSPMPTYSVSLVEPAASQEAAYNPVWACVGHENQIQVEPGATRVDTLKLHGPNLFRGEIGLGVLEGRFRLHFGAQHCQQQTGCGLPDSLGTSNEFTVRLAR